MKGIGKALSRAPQLVGSKVGLSKKSQDLDFDDLARRFGGLEEYTKKLLTDTTTFRDGVASMMGSQAGFATAFSVIFQPILNETSLTTSHPEAADTLRNIAAYQDLMQELRDAIQPELELIDARITGPLKEYNELLKKIRKTITKREHKLTDYDRHNNAYQKLKDKKEKSLTDEKNLFKVEQDLELATQEYEHYNNSLKTEIPHFIQLTTAFIAPIFQTFYFVKVGILYTLLEKMQGWQGDIYGSMPMEQVEQMHAERFVEPSQRLEELTINKRYAGSARFLQQRQNSGSSVGTRATLGRTPSTTTASSSYSKPPVRGAYGAAAAAVPEPSPPPYSSPAAGGGATPLAGKRPPPPPPPAKPRAGGPAVQYVTALYDYAATAEGDLSFTAGDKIQLVKKTDSAEDWWTGKLDGVEGVFPGNYVQL